MHTPNNSRTGMVVHVNSTSMISADELRLFEVVGREENYAGRNWGRNQILMFIAELFCAHGQEGIYIM